MGAPVIAGASQSKPSAPLPVPQWIVDDARLVGRSRCEVHMDEFVRVNGGKKYSKPNKVGYFIRPSGCWEWTGYRMPSGYGKWSPSHGESYYAHRRMYELHKGPIPESKQLDHLCRNRGCVNPAHLEPVTARENLLRGKAPTIVAHKRGTCLLGHNDWHTYPNGKRRCRPCLVEQRKVYIRPERRRAIELGEWPKPPRTHCKRGHSNYQVNTRGSRVCLDCQRSGDARRHRERRAKARLLAACMAYRDGQ